MAAARAVRYYGGGDLSGYGLAAVANVRALLNAGVAVQWIPLQWTPRSMYASEWITAGTPLPVLREHAGDVALADLPALIRATSAVCAHDSVIVHAPPEFWPTAFEPGRRNVGCTAWEADRMPAHWLPLLQAADRVVVPCRLNREVFVRGGVRRPIEVIPHIRRHAWNEFTPSQRAEARADLDIPADHKVVYTINSWDPRKALPSLIDAFVRAFDATDPVTLVIKTHALGSAAGPLYPLRPTRELAAEATTRAAAACGRTPAPIRLLDEEVDGAAIDLLHALGDVYASLSHGEGWGLGAFDAATRGTPVVMTGWGGHTDFLGSDSRDGEGFDAGWPGAVPYRLAPVALWPPGRPSYFPSQRWAECDLDAAARLLRAAVFDPDPARAAADAIRERIVREYAEPLLAQRWLRMLDG